MPYIKLLLVSLLLLLCPSVSVLTMAGGESRLGLSTTAKAMLNENGFVILEQEYPTFSALFQDNEASQIPQFITSDSILYLTHVVIDASLRAAEVGYLRPNIEEFLGHLWERCSEAYADMQQCSIKEELGKVLLYLSVSLHLLGKSPALPSSLSDQAARVDQELDLIRANAKPTVSPLLGYAVDYSQFKPRGHYTASEDFTQYFRAIKWLALPFRLKERSETLESLLLTKFILQDNVLYTAWADINDFQRYLAGPSDELSVEDYKSLVTEVYGKNLELGTFEDPKRLTAFIDQTKKTLRKPQVLPYWAAAERVPRGDAQGFALFPSRLLPDSLIFQGLVYDKVGTQEKPRNFPKGLDLFAVFGNKAANQILLSEGDFNYAHYKEQLITLQGKVDDFEKDWRGTLYWKWLSSLMVLQTPSRAIDFPNSPKWEYKQLYTSLGGWTLMRHDTVLYTKESIAMPMGLNVLTKGYVEPYPAFYKRLGKLVGDLQGYFQKHALAKQVEFTVDDLHITDLKEFLDFLEEVARKEVAGVALSKEEYQKIWEVGNTFRAIKTFPNEVSQTLSIGDTLPLVTEVHTDVNSGKHLLEGVGKVYPIVVAITRDRKTTLMRGGVFSYYEWKSPERLTDAEWRRILQGTGPQGKPQLPSWIDSIMVLIE